MTSRRSRPIRNKGVLAEAKRQRRPAPGKRLDFRVDPWTRRLIRPVLITILASSVAVALSVLVETISPAENWMALAPFYIFVSLEGALTAAWLNNPDSRGIDRGIYRAAELIFLLVLARVVSWLMFGEGFPTPVEMRLYLSAPLSTLAGGGFLTTAFITLVTWWLASTTSRIFAKLDVSIYEINFYTLPAAEQKATGDDRPIQISREALLGQYLQTWLSVGMVLVLIAALSTYEVGELAATSNLLEISRLGMHPAMLFALLAYFLAGFWLLSHARLLRMNARWLMDGVAMEPSLERSWQRNALGSLLAIALLALFLPIGSSLAISRILSIALVGLSSAVALIFSFFSFLFVSALVALTRNVEQGDVRPTPELTLPPPATPAPPSGAPDPFFTMLISTAFWTLIIAFVIASITFFLRERGYHIGFDDARRYRAMIAEWLRNGWARLRGRLRATRRGIGDSFTLPTPSVHGPSIPSWTRPPRLSTLSPREQIRYYYLSLARRAREKGVARRTSETPLEYEDKLKKAWPDMESDFTNLTNAFLEARYSRQPIPEEAVNPLKERWRRIRNRIRARD